MPKRSLALAALAAAALALETAPPPWGAGATVASVLAGLGAGLGAPRPARGRAVRAAALGSAVGALGRGFLLWRVGGADALSVGATLPPALVGLDAFVLAVLTGRWWRGIWRLEPEPGPLSRLGRG